MALPPGGGSKPALESNKYSKNGPKSRTNIFMLLGMSERWPRTAANASPSIEVKLSSSDICSCTFSRGDGGFRDNPLVDGTHIVTKELIQWNAGACRVRRPDDPRSITD